jgi:hypothetical protein
MGQLNANMPYIGCVKSMLNRPLHFHFQGANGAVFWNMPISAFVHREDYAVLSDDEAKRLQLLESWDCQSNNIAVTTFAFLQNKRVDIFCRDRQWRSGKYITTRVKVFKEALSSEDIDRSYGNSPYYFYGYHSEGD